ncbi:hypothetical protein [Paludibaculum fermentans]|uniref:Uncharacterized protein n=1 Tax=Paludibaculum fermentans TaxID=1473598 RepID=A0A7S7NUN6_PALFE|nr:hypothetical protein [Paludibaculum fermentans]QOY90075.1 hypothetical protein IRI77_09005 [Paludibaculum fermentans]
MLEDAALQALYAELGRFGQRHQRHHEGLPLKAAAEELLPNGMPLKDYC